MTSGNKTIDNRTTVSLPGHGSSKVGYYSSKTWTGGDQPKRTPIAGKGVFRSFFDLQGREHFWDPKKPPKRSGLSEHPYSASGKHRYDGYGTYGTATDKTMFDINQNWPPSSNGIPLWNSNRDLSLINKLRSRILGSSFDLGVFLAEGHEALKTIADAARRLRIAQHALRRGRPYDCWLALVQGAWRQPRPPAHIRHEVLTSQQVTDAWLSRNWLQLQYGWIPLVEDIYDGAEFLAHQLNVPAKRVYRASSRFGGDFPATVDIVRDGFYLRGKTIKAVVSEVNVPVLSGLVNPATIIWERLPYSFVCDWAYPVGAWLQARGVASALSGVFTTSYYERTYTCNARPTPAYSNSYPNFTSSPNIYEWWKVERTVSSSLSVPMPSVKPLNEVLTWKHAANAVALLVTSGILRRSSL